MIAVHAALPIRPDRREEALDLVADLAEATRAEEGVIEYHATVDLEDENVVRFFEQYEDQAALDAHMRTDHYVDLMGELLEMLADDPEVTQFVVEEAFDPNADDE